MTESRLNNLVSKENLALWEQSKVLVKQDAISESDFSYTSKSKALSISQNKQKSFKENLSHYRYLPHAIYGKYGIITDSEHIHDKLYQELANFLSRRKTSSLEDIPFEFERPIKQLSSKQRSQSLDNVSNIASIRKILENTMWNRLKENPYNEEDDTVRIIDNVLEEEEKKDLSTLSSDNKQYELQPYSFDILSQQGHSLFPQRLSFIQNSDINMLINAEKMEEKTYLVKYKQTLSKKITEPIVDDPFFFVQYSGNINKISILDKNLEKASILDTKNKTTFQGTKSSTVLETSEKNKEKRNLFLHWETKKNSHKISVGQKGCSEFHGLQDDVIYSSTKNRRKITEQLANKNLKSVLDKSECFSRNDQKHCEQPNWQCSKTDLNFISFAANNHHCKNSNIKLVLNNYSIIKDSFQEKADVPIGK